MVVAMHPAVRQCDKKGVNFTQGLDLSEKMSGKSKKNNTLKWKQPLKCFRCKSISLFGFSEVFGGPAGFRKVREVCRKNFLRYSSKSDFMVSSYDQKTNSRRLTPRVLKFERNAFG